MNEYFEDVVQQLVEKIDEVDCDLQSFVAGFIYGMQIGKLLYTEINKQVGESNDFISTQILKHYNLEVQNENISSGTM